MRAIRGSVTVSFRPADHFCDTFDLTCRIPLSVIEEVHNAKRLIPLDLTINNDLASSMDGLVNQIKHVLATTPLTEVVRLCIAALGSPEWGECCPAVRDKILPKCNPSRIHRIYYAFCMSYDDCCVSIPMLVPVSPLLRTFARVSGQDLDGYKRLVG